MRLDGTMSIAIHVKDWRAAAAWYRSVFGFTPVYESDDLGFCELTTSVPGVTVLLSEPEDDALLGTVIPTFGVTDAVEAHARMKQVGVEVGDPEHFPGVVKTVTLKDPDENTLLLCETLEEQPQT